jgi:hypothetical protein
LLLWSGKQPKITKFKGKFKRRKGRRPGKKPGQSENAPKVFWKVIKFDIAESQSDVESVFTDWLDAKVQEAAKLENLVYDENKKKYKASFNDMDAYGLSEVFKNELSRAVSLAKSRRNRGRKGGAGDAYIGGADQLSGLKFSSSKTRDFDPIPLPSTKTVLWSETMKSAEEIEHRSHIFERMRVKSHARKLTFSTFRTITEGSGVKLGSRNLWRAVGIPPAYIIAGDPQKNDLVHRVAAILTGVGMKNVLRASTNLVPKSITQAPVVTVKQSPTGSVTSSVSKSVTPASMPAPSTKTSTVSKQTPTTVAVTAAATAASSASTVAPPPATALTLEDQIMEKARAMAVRDHPNVPGNMWDKFGNDYISFARSILTKERVK